LTCPLAAVGARHGLGDEMARKVLATSRNYEDFHSILSALVQFELALIAQFCSRMTLLTTAGGYKFPV